MAKNRRRALWLTMLFAACVLIACRDDVKKAKLAARNEPHKVTLYSGGVATREWISIGHPQSEGGSVRIYFLDEKTGYLVRVSGDVTIERLK